MSDMGRRTMGFMSVMGSTRAALACHCCAQDMNEPSASVASRESIFWALNGATRTPSSDKIRQSAAASVVLPTLDAVPRTAIAGVLWGIDLAIRSEERREGTRCRHEW